MIGMTREELAASVDEIFAKNTDLIEKILSKTLKSASNDMETLTKLQVASFRELTPLVMILLLEKNNQIISEQIDKVVEARVKQALSGK